MIEHRIPTLPVTDIEEGRRFYTRVLGCRHTVLLSSRSPAPKSAADESGAAANGPRVDLELFGQPISLHRRADLSADTGSRLVLVLNVDDWCTLSERLREHDIEHDIETARRFSIEPGEQCAIRLRDPDGNVVELRGFAAEETQLAA